ncbi:hypothetical protein [Bdellovibrio bacteriovorus]|uniref:hypothetical protein n=1 Tax=Bdellovibrio TaxID=958 RepID=UPI0035A8DB9D
MKKSYQIATFFVAAVGLSIGFLGNPFGAKEHKMGPQELDAIYQKTKIYFHAGNFEGAVDAARKLPKEIPPRYADIREVQRQSEEALKKYKKQLQEGALSPRHVDRLPAALRDSYFDAKIEAKQGRCRQAYENMAPVSRYLNNREDLEIFKRCQLTKNKSK